MSIDTGNALIVGGSSALIGFGLAYYVFKKLIAEKYGKGKEKANSIYYWSGFISMIAVGQGAGTVFNELLFSLTNNSSINGDAIARGLITIFIYPLLIALVAFLISFFLQKTSKVASSNHSEAPISDVGTGTFAYSARSLVISFALIVALVVGYFAINSGFSFAKEKKFEVVECITCRTMGATKVEDCSLQNYLKYFIVSDSKLVSYSTTADGQPVIYESPASDEKCIFNSSGKFSFVCSSNSVSEQHKSNWSREFDGASNFKSTLKAYIFLYGDYRLLHEDKKTCKMKG